MSVDIGFFAEARVDGRWHRVRPALGNSSSALRQDDERALFYGSVYPFEHFLEKCVPDWTALPGKNTILSQEMQEKVAGYQGYGMFLFSVLLDYCNDREKELVSRLEDASEYGFKHQLDRIEAMMVSLFSGGKYKEPETDGDRAVDVYGSWKEKNASLLYLKEVACGIIALFRSVIGKEDLRFVYVLK